MSNTMNEILDIEWEMFHSTKNEGGTASCQQDKPQFNVMRSSQFLGWDKATLESYLDDLKSAEAEGRNLMTEKYAYMMESTAPINYMLIKEKLPEISEEKEALAAELVALNVKWAEEFHAKYPKIASKGRPIYKSADNEWVTSVETYNRGEVLTYSEKTMRLLLDSYKAAEAEGRNLYSEVLFETVRQLGYTSLEEAENAQQ